MKTTAGLAQVCTVFVKALTYSVDVSANVYLSPIENNQRIPLNAVVKMLLACGAFGIL